MVFDYESWMDTEHPHFETHEEIVGYLALKHANGASMYQILFWHGEILAQIGYDYVKKWKLDDEKYLNTLVEGADFVLNHIEWPADWHLVYNSPEDSDE